MTTEKLVQDYAATPQNRALVALIEIEIERHRDMLETAVADEVAALQGAVRALRSLHRVLSGLSA